MALLPRAGVGGRADALRGLRLRHDRRSLRLGRARVGGGMRLRRRLVVAGSSRALAALRRRRLGRLLALRLLRHDRLGRGAATLRGVTATTAGRAIGVGCAAGSPSPTGRARCGGCCTDLDALVARAACDRDRGKPDRDLRRDPAPPPTAAAVPAAVPAPIVGRPVAAAALGAPLNSVSENGSGRIASALNARRCLMLRAAIAGAARALVDVRDEAPTLLAAEAAVRLRARARARRGRT